MRRFLFIASLVGLLVVLGTGTGCRVYSFADVSIPDSIKTVRINFIENRAQYVNPRLAPNLTDRLKQKIVNQTRLTQTNNENAHYDISSFISSYTVSTSGVSTSGTGNQRQRESSMNRLTVGVHIVLNDRLGNKTQEFDVSRSFDFQASLALQQAEAALLDAMVRDLTDDIFNRIFSNW
ncbi:MAG TPA: LPS assembly lipoprotein LptE [Chitinophagaceae bacterium]|jgi:outer membrane lipopolysaccharide assembly protein LptE/RlpB|nr:LPS assembly lipoprotein LptE [Chitinophagaceae bacterium]